MRIRTAAGFRLPAAISDVLRPSAPHFPSCLLPGFLPTAGSRRPTLRPRTVAMGPSFHTRNATPYYHRLELRAAQIIGLPAYFKPTFLFRC